MGKYYEVRGDLIAFAKQGTFDVITHGCNCFCTMGAGIAPQMANAFGADKFPKESTVFKGDINKLGTIDFQEVRFNWSLNRMITDEEVKSGTPMPFFTMYVVNSYTQFGFGSNHANGSAKPIDYQALELCLRKINHVFKGKHIGLPMIGAGLAGGDWRIIKKIIKRVLSDCDVTVVIFDK